MQGTMRICGDCVMAHANGDFTGMDEATEVRVKDGMDRTGPLYVVSDENGVVDSHFSWSACDGCGDRLGGDRYDADDAI